MAEIALFRCRAGSHVRVVIGDRTASWKGLGGCHEATREKRREWPQKFGSCSRFETSAGRGVPDHDRHANPSVLNGESASILPYTQPRLECVIPHVQNPR